MEPADGLKRCGASTDTIIEEIKALAKSMLESTEAIRRRSRNVESCKSYDALLSVLESTAPLTKHPARQQRTQGHNDVICEFPVTRGGGISGGAAANNAKPGNCYAKKVSGDVAEFCESELDDTEAEVTSCSPEACGEDGHDLGGFYPNSKAQLFSACTMGADFSADSDDNVYDGVKTQVVFKAVDPALYQDISGCTWQPEPLLLHSETGEAVEDSSEDKDEDKESDYMDDAAVVGTKKVYRVPSFPFGGGITEGQARFLSKTFSETIRRGGLSSSKRPAHVTVKDFVGYKYDECATTDAERSRFKPVSPFEFVVELERGVMFDAVRAREERRQEFRRLAKEGKAPVTMGSFNLRVIMDPIKTGFEEEKTFPIERGTIVADRYQIVEMLGKATFSRAVRCYDLSQPIYEDDVKVEDKDRTATTDAQNRCVDTENGGVSNDAKKRKVVGYVEVCLKIINNSKDFFDQSLDEIRLLTLINKYKDPDKAHVIRLIDSFYYKEHTMLVTELLSDNLYEYSKYNREEEETFYFTIPRLRRIARQITEALTYVHSLSLIHADLKPENILFVSHRRCLIKVIDFGSSCFLSDHLSSYIQSRSYRAPEVILGCDYDGRIDVWSLGAILAELVTGEVLFTSETVPEMLARIVYVCGRPFPRRMLWEGRHTSKFINKFGCIYEQGNKDGDDPGEDSSYYYLYTPVPQSSGIKNPDAEGTDAENNGTRDTESLISEERPYRVLREKLAAHNVTDSAFISFVEACLTLDHKARPRSKDLLSHPFLAQVD